MYGFIYKITCLKNNKLYIGQTTKTIEWRFEKHLYDAEKSKNPRLHFQRAIKKYGKDAFKIEKIDEAKNQNELNEKEKYWIKFYNSIENGYNTAEGGEGGNTYKGRTQEEMELTKKKISEANKGRNNGNSNQLKCFSIKTKEEHFFETLGDCLNFLGIKNKSIVMDRANKKINSYWHHEWMFAYENEEYGEYIDKPDYDSSCRKGKKVILKKNNEIKEFNSLNKAREFLGIKQRPIDGSIINGYKVQFS